MRVVFVDDDVNVLQAMRRSMHGMRHEWHMEFLPSGADALASLAQSPADVIVSDMRMPGMDGRDLLTKVKDLYPQTVRLVLSGYAEPAAIMRLVGIAHQYIAKPGESAVLKAAIAQTKLMRDLLNNPELALLVGGVDTLPCVPAAFQEISSCLQSKTANVAKVAQVISHDVAMTANIMKLVNSAFFGARRQVTSVERAVAYLGWDTLIALVLGHGLFKSIGTSAGETLWQHSLSTAMAARAIATNENLPQARVEEAFLTGMLHDVGRVVYATRAGQPSTGPNPVEFAKIDNSQPAGDHHVEVGAYLLGLWGFPSQIVAAVALHGSPGRRADAGFDLTVLVHLADRLANARGDESLPVAELCIEPGLLEGLGIVERLPHWRAAVARTSPIPV